MAMRIVWTEQANKALEFIFTCALDFYGKNKLKKLRSDIQRYETILTNNPKIGAIEQIVDDVNVEFRHVVMTKPFKLIFFILDETIYIADIWDARQDPNALSNRLEH